jgi:hypothetical protein
LWWNQWWMEQTTYVHYSLTREINKLRLWTFHRIHKVFIIRV